MPRTVPTRAFLPADDPLQQLPEDYRLWHELLHELPSLLAAGRARHTLQRMPVLDTNAIEDDRERELALGVLSVFGHAAVHESWRTGSASTVPASIAIPWVEVAKALQRQPVLTYATHGLFNWRRIDADGPVALGNLAVSRHFFGGLDENWFVATHVDIEARATPLVRAICQAQDAVRAEDDLQLLDALNTMSTSIAALCTTLAHIRDNCDPHVFFHRVQPFMQGMKGVVYEGVAELAGEPQNHPGGSGAQSALMPLLDASLGIEHAGDALHTYLKELRRYMPQAHDAFLRQVEDGPSIRAYLLGHQEPALRAAYNQCIEAVGSFRAEHLRISIDYIQRPAQQQQQASARGERGTGGSPFVGYLEKHRKETFDNLLQ